MRNSELAGLIEYWTVQTAGFGSGASWFDVTDGAEARRFSSEFDARDYARMRQLEEGQRRWRVTRITLLRTFRRSVRMEEWFEVPHPEKEAGAAEAVPA